MGLGFGENMNCVALQQESCAIVSNRNFSYEQVYPFLGFSASSMDASSIDAARTAFNWTAQTQGWLLISQQQGF